MDPDKRVFSLWRKFERHPDKERPVTFYFYFPDKNKAELAGVVLKREGFEVDIDTPLNPGEWSCIGYKTMVPEYAEIHDLRQWLEKIAEDLDGNYDGWETETFID
ncbi:MAG: ribonuclease E inhibitor RraB [Candidatus Marinimicrobia bacterium]|nr:ribonuclease E inhibitor RraB [Candidatus Neomarinimicrobiota bacterium]